MSATVALATATDAWHRDDDAPALVAALEALGCEVVPAVWDDPGVDWAGMDLVVVRSTWDYTARRGAFLEWARRVESVTRLHNPAAVLEWNTDKRYLTDLTTAGVPVVPTAVLSAADPASWQRAEEPFALAGADGDVVVKPTVSAGSKDTARHRHDAAGAAAATAHARQLLDDGRDVLLQPYLDSVDDHGETGMVFFDGQLSHGFRKGPLLRDGVADVDGLFAQEQITDREPTSDERALGTQVLKVLAERFGPSPLLYARIDVLAGERGPVLLEAELTEPSWFLDRAPAAATRAAAAIAAALER